MNKKQFLHKLNSWMTADDVEIVEVHHIMPKKIPYEIVFDIINREGSEVKKYRFTRLLKYTDRCSSYEYELRFNGLYLYYNADSNSFSKKYR